MRRTSAVLLLLLAPACATHPEVDMRYRAEREIWNINREVRRLTIKPELVEEATWRAIAARYEHVATTYGQVPVRQDAGADAQAARDARAIVARALISAAQVYTTIGDSTQMLATYERVASGFQDVPSAVAEVALAQGRIAEGKRDWEKAAGAYQMILDRIEPLPGDTGVAGTVMELPLRIARLHDAAATAIAAADSASHQPPAPDVARYYEDARAQYSRWIAAHPNSAIELEARAQLADLAAARGEWETALLTLRQLEADLKQRTDPPQEPAAVRLAMANVQARAQAPAESTQSTLLSVVADYPKSAAAPQALLALANFAASHKLMDPALTYLDRLQDEYPNAEELNAQGMLMRGRILDADGRWKDALEAYRTLPVRHPVSEAALQAPLDIVQHYQRAEDSTETRSALERAEHDYRDFLDRYPPGPRTLSARAKLVQTLVLQKKYDAAVAELLAMSDAPVTRQQAAGFLVDAARIAYNSLGDAKRAAEILDRLASRYPNQDIGRWATAEAARLREAK